MKRILGFIAPTAICRHSKDDPDCSSNRDRRIDYTKLAGSTSLRTVEKPDAENFEIVDAVEVGRHLVMKVLYPNCGKCSYEGMKVMVFLNVSPLKALKWKRIDPHFREPGAAVAPGEAPGPNARFPASNHGWDDAIAYAKSHQ